MADPIVKVTELPSAVWVAQYWDMPPSVEVPNPNYSPRGGNGHSRRIQADLEDLFPQEFLDGKRGRLVVRVEFTPG